MQDFDPIAYINEPRWQEVKPGLQRTECLLEKLGNPEKQLKFVHVAGTNGKGSTSAFLASILKKASYKTGLFTSPFIVEFNDRIRINGENISHQRLKEVTLKVKEAAESMEDHPTEFELMTAVAFLYFAEEKCDIVVCEVGMGGRLDSTNVIESPEVCVIAAIAIDHAAILGNTLSAIAREKGGIIKQGIPVVSWPQEQEARDTIERIAHEKQTTIGYPDFDCLHVGAIDAQAFLNGEGLQSFSYKQYEDISLQLLGDYQPYNATLVIEVVEILRGLGWGIPDEALREGFAETAWPGRFEIVGTHPLIVLDGAHNVQGVKALVSSWHNILPETKPVFIVGLLEDKEYSEMLKEVVAAGRAFITVKPPSPRALTADRLARAIEWVCQQNPRCEHVEPPYVANSFDDAFAHARQLAGEDGVICAFGSLYSIASLKVSLA